MQEENYKKNFKYTLKSKSGKIILQSIVSFGSEEYPFPKDWENNGMAQRSIFDFKEDFINQNFDFTIEEGDVLDDFPLDDFSKDVNLKHNDYSNEDGCKFK